MENEKQVLINCQRLIDPSVIIRDLTAMKSMYDAIALDGIIKALKEAPTVDAEEVVHAYWTGFTPKDHVFAEGFPTEMTPEEKAKRLVDFMHTTHCSNCFGGFDARDVKYWRYCPYCAAKMDGDGQ